MSNPTAEALQAALPDSFQKAHAAGCAMLHCILNTIDSGQPIPALTVDEIDEALADYGFYEREFETQKKALDEAKRGVIALVQAHGSVPPHAEQSRRLHGRRNQAVVITATATMVYSTAVDDLRGYLRTTGNESIFFELFAEETKYKLIESARTVLGKIALPQRVHEKVLSLFGRCFDVKPKSPSLKVSVITPEKPAKKARGGKAAA